MLLFVTYWFQQREKQMQILRDIKTGIEKLSDTTLQTQYENLIDDLFLMDEDEIQAYGEDLLSDVEYTHECEAADAYQYQSYESIYGCPARL